MEITNNWLELLDTYRKRFIKAKQKGAAHMQAVKQDYYYLKETLNEDFIDAGWEYIVSGSLRNMRRIK